MPSFIDFLRTGRLGQVSAGMSPAEVRGLLGQPTDVSAHRFPVIWKYGPVQLTFYKLPDASDPFLVMLTVEFDDAEDSPPDALEIPDWQSLVDCDYSAFEKMLGDQGITVVGGVTSGENKHLVLPSGVRVSFVADRLCHAGYTLKREPATRQLTINVARTDLDLLQKWAKSRGISVADLCSEWITEQVSSRANATSR
jgi:hypothetical protein